MKVGIPKGDREKNKTNDVEINWNVKLT